MIKNQYKIIKFKRRYIRFLDTLTVYQDNQKESLLLICTYQSEGNRRESKENKAIQLIKKYFLKQIKK